MCALAFTVLSFWWLNARQGRLKSYVPHTFAAAVTPERTLVRLPVILFNTGPKPIVVQNLRLAFLGVGQSVRVLSWRTTRDRIRPEREDDPRLPSVFVVNGRTAIQLFVEFGVPFPDFIPDPREYAASIECKVGHRKNWFKLLEFTLRLQNMTSPGSYIPYSNETVEVSASEVERALTELQSLRAKAAVD